jgi:hypothetical protein
MTHVARSSRRPRRDERERGRLVAVVVVAAALAAVVGLVAVRSQAQPATPAWVPFDAATFHVELPAPPTTRTVPDGATVVAAVVGQVAYVVVTYPVPAAARPLDALQHAVHELGRAPAVLTSLHPASAGAFLLADVTARLPSDFLYGRVVVGGQRGYLVGEITPTADAPSDLHRLLVGFEPE